MKKEEDGVQEKVRDCYMQEEARRKVVKEAKEAAKAEQIRNQKVLDMEETTTTEVCVQTLQDIGYMEENSCEVSIVYENILTQDFIKSDEPKALEAVKFCTGLKRPSYARIMAVFNFVSADLKEHNSNLTLFQQFLVTLFKLCLN